jgi:serine/threonine protein kinase
MDSERLKQIEEIYHAALEVSPAERESFLAESCGADKNLRREVESLLAFEKTSGNFVDAPPEALAAEILVERENRASLINRTIGHYNVKRLLGKGGMGEVYLAEDARLNRKVALKILPENFAADLNNSGRFEQEAKAVSALNHPNILTVYEFGVDDGRHFLATELIEGNTLREKIREGEMSLTDALSIVEQIAFALAAAHAAGIVHRDVKPENVMIRRDGIVKVLDFGIAKFVAPLAESVDAEGETMAKIMTQTKPGTILGTLNYMSPEQVRGQTADARSDIFSLGVVLYEMLVGKTPFEKPNSGDVIAAILTENPAPVTRTRPEAPAELQRIVAKTLKKDKEERYQTSKDLLLDIKNLEREIEYPTNLPPLVTADKTPLTENLEVRVTEQTKNRRFSPVWALAVFLAAILIGAGIWRFVARDDFQAEPLRQLSAQTTELVNWRSAPGEIYSSGSFSPDGKMIAFASTQNGAKNIWVKQLSGGEAVQITKDEFANQNPIWSPDGSEIAFYSARSGTSGIWRMPSFGGAPTFVKTIEDGSMILRRWSAKGIVYYESKQNLFALDIKSRQSTQLTDFDSAKAKPNFIGVSPDESQIAYVVFENERYVVWTMPFRGGSPAQVAGFPEEVRNVVWHADGKRVLYSRMIDGIFQIFAAETGGERAQVTFGEKNAFALDVSADGSKILYGSSKEESDLWSVDVEKAEEFPFASDIDSELWANASPDGKTIAFQSIKNLSQGDKIAVGAIVTKPANSDAQPFQLVAEGSLPTWSPEGNQLAFLRLSGETFNVWIIKADGGEEKQLTNGGIPSVEYTVLPYNRTQASYINWSPDGKKIAYVSNDGGLRDVWTIHADGSNNARLTNNHDSNLHLSCPIWSIKDDRVAYSAKSNQRLANDKRFYAAYVIDIKTKNSKIVAQSETFQRLLGWSESGKELILAAVKDKDPKGAPTEVTIIQVDTESGERRETAKLESTYLYNIYLSADKKMLAYVAKKDGGDNIWTMRASGGANAAAPRKITSNNDPKLYFSSLSWSPANRVVYFGKQTRYSLLSAVTNFK